MKIRVHQIEPSDGSPGDIATINPAGDAVEFLPAAGGGGSSLSWFVVTDPVYGAIGDGVADDTAAVNAAIAALNVAGRGVLYFPAGIYKTTAALTTITAKARITGDGSGDAYGNGATIIVSTSATAYMFHNDCSGNIWEDMCWFNTNGSETAGAALYVTHGENNRYRNLMVYGFYDNVYVEHGGVWQMTGCFFTKPVRYSVYINYITGPDGGDQAISDCWFYAKDRNAVAAIHLERGGGLKVSNCKINTNSGTGYYTYGIDLDIPSGVTTGVLIVTGTSIENVAANGIRVALAGSANYDTIVIDGVEIAFYTSGSGAAISLSCATTGNIRCSIISGAAMRANPSRSVAAIVLSGVTNTVIGDRVYEGFTTGYAATGGSGIVDGMGGGGVATTRQIATDSTLTGGGDLSADRTLGVNTTSELERIQDAVAAMIVAGSGMATPVYDDTLGTLTLATSGGSGSGSSLVPITTLDGSGNLIFITAEDGSIITGEV